MQVCEECRFWLRWKAPNRHVTHDHGDCHVTLPPWLFRRAAVLGQHAPDFKDRHTHQDHGCDLGQPKEA